MPSFLYLADHVLPNPTPTFSSCVIARHSSARVTRLLTVSRRAVSYFRFSVPLDVLLPLPRWPFSPQKTSLQTLLKAHLLPKALFPSPAVLHTLALTDSYTTQLPYIHFYISLSKTQSHICIFLIPFLTPSTIPDSHEALHGGLLNAKVHFFPSISLACWRNIVSTFLSAFLFFIVEDVVGLSS